MHIENDTRHWGSFRRFTENDPSTVKLIDIRAGQSISLQRHSHRDEFWVILSGNPKITIGDMITHATSNDEFFIPRETLHRIMASDDAAVRLLEIAFGDFDEDDIIRTADSYGRS